jgi:hypothetical protein
MMTHPDSDDVAVTAIDYVAIPLPMDYPMLLPKSFHSPYSTDYHNSR